MLDLKEWKNITLEDIYHPIYQANARIFVNIMFGISFFVYFLTLYVLVTQSTPYMDIFKKTMILQTTWNFIFILFLFIYYPIFYWPLPFISYNSIFSIRISYPMIQGSLVYFSVIGIGVSFCNTILFRLLATFQKQFLFFQSQFSLVCVFIFIVGGAFTFVFVPLWLMERDPTEMQQKIENIVPVFIEIYKFHPNTFGIIPDYNDGSFMFFMGSLIFMVVVSFFVIVILHGAFLYQMKKIKKFVSKETFSIHQMLHRAMLVQLSVAVVFIFGPVLLIAIPFLLQLKNGSWISSFALPLGILFMMFDALCLFYFVKPYREFFISRLFCLKFLRQTKVQPIPSRTIP